MKFDPLAWVRKPLRVEDSLDHGAVRIEIEKEERTLQEKDKRLAFIRHQVRVIARRL
jgi:hypothetical protein